MPAGTSFGSNGPQFKAGATIAPRTALKLSTAAPNTVLPAGAGDYVVGISGQSTRGMPGLDGWDPAIHALAGEPVTMVNIGEVGQITTAAAVALTDLFVKSNASALAIPVTNGGGSPTLQQVIGVPMHACGSGEVLHVWLRPQLISR